MSTHKSSKSFAATVMPEAKTRFSKRKKLIIGSIIIFIVALGGATAFIVHRHIEDQKNKTLSGAKKIPDAKYVETMGDSFNTQSNSQSNTHSVKLAEEQNDGSFERESILAIAYVRDKQYDKAFVIYDKYMKQNRLTANTLSGAAQAALIAGQKDRAIKYYEAAKIKIQEPSEKAQNPQWQDEIARYDRQIKELKSGNQ